MRIFARLSLAPLLLLIAPITLVSSGCRKPAIHLLVPPGYAGRVIVDCSSNESTGTTVQIDPHGHGRAASCPRDGARVYLDRNGSSTTIEGVEWLKTGDGFTTQFRFNLN